MIQVVATYKALLCFASGARKLSGGGGVECNFDAYMPYAVV